MKKSIHRVLFIISMMFIVTAAFTILQITTFTTSGEPQSGNKTESTAADTTRTAASAETKETAETTAAVTTPKATVTIQQSPTQTNTDKTPASATVQVTTGKTSGTPVKTTAAASAKTNPNNTSATSQGTAQTSGTPINSGITSSPKITNTEISPIQNTGTGAETGTQSTQGNTIPEYTANSGLMKANTVDVNGIINKFFQNDGKSLNNNTGNNTGNKGGVSFLVWFIPIVVIAAGISAIWIIINKKNKDPLLADDIIEDDIFKEK